MLCVLCACVVCVGVLCGCVGVCLCDHLGFIGPLNVALVALLAVCIIILLPKMANLPVRLYIFIHSVLKEDQEGFLVVLSFIIDLGPRLG